MNFDFEPPQLVWDSLSANELGSMPLGNGDLGLNVWVEEGAFCFYIAKTDAWSEIGRLLKIGRVRVEISPDPFAAHLDFRQILRCGEGEITVEAGNVQLRIWADANAPVVHLEIAATDAVAVRVTSEVWRDSKRQLKGTEKFSAYGYGETNEAWEEGDLVLDAADRVLWCHRNPTENYWRETMRVQSFDSAELGPDPLANRTFGALLEGEGFVCDGNRVLDARARTHHHLRAVVLTSQTATLQDWQSQISILADQIAMCDLESARAAHLAWWKAFWERSFIQIDGDEDARLVSQNYALQRFVNACAGRGAFPIKFNGSLFTVAMPDEEFAPPHEKTTPLNADYRRWGGPYWFQNTRLAYWPMLSSGDFDLMEPFFAMYRAALPMAKRRVQLMFGHGGAMLPETMEFWGAFANSDYGWKRENRPVSWIKNEYVRFYYHSVLELAWLALQRLEFSPSVEFARETAIPLADEFLTFYNEHFERDENGLLCMEGIYSLETNRDVRNPAPDVAGLHAILNALARLPIEYSMASQRDKWARLRRALPAVPLDESGEKARLAVAEVVRDTRHNTENAELYALFPYRIYGVGRADLELARHTYETRLERSDDGWNQNAIDAAWLGLADEAAALIVARTAKKHEASRFPIFWGPNFDWVPDQDHGNVVQMALQSLLLQWDESKIYLLAAWPARWSARFRLHAPHNTVVEGRVESGQLMEWNVFPPARRDDVILSSPGGDAVKACV